MSVLWQSIAPDFYSHRVFVFRRVFEHKYFHAIESFDIVPRHCLVGLEYQIEMLESNTLAFLEGRPCTNALLWGMRGMGKSACVKAVLLPYILSNEEPYSKLRIIEVGGKDLEILPLIFDHVSSLEFRFIIFCDDLVFDKDNNLYGNFKSSLEGSFADRPSNILIYVTSNLKHAIHEDSSGDSSYGIVDEMMSLSERFPLNMGFYPISKREYLNVLRGMIYEHLLHINGHVQDLNESLMQTRCNTILDRMSQHAINFATKAGNRSPRVARDFFNIYFDAIFK